MAKYAKAEDNKFYSVEDYRSLLNDFVESLRSIIDKNTRIGDSFKEVESDIQRIAEMASFTEHLEEIEAMVGSEGQRVGGHRADQGILEVHRGARPGQPPTQAARHPQNHREGFVMSAGRSKR